MYSILFGAVAGIIYDVFRIVRIAVQHNALSVFFEDILFCLICTVMLILFVFCANYGVVRWFSFFGWMCGFYIYRETVGKAVIAVSDAIIRFVKNNIIKPILRVSDFLTAAFFRGLQYVFVWIDNLIVKIKKRLYLTGLLFNAVRGFGL
ncbi:MAG: spore cortex biosynthesis protein YabQ [Clostridia bacterium]|nr:spore cortex biosynthesis protein YabQ [Clostridia bacterium]